MKQLLLTIFALVLLFAPLPASAHTNGVPFISINSQPVLTNPVFTGYVDQKMLIPQDLAPETYLSGTQLTFTIDPKALGFPQETLDQSKLRWSFDSGSTDYATEANPRHTYSSIGSHIAILEILFPGNPEYIVYDTIQIDIVPTKNYKRPTAIITTNGINADTTKEITFTQKTTTDPTSSVQSYLWKLDSGIYSTETQPIYNYKRTNFFEQVYLQVNDTNGFQTTTVISVTNGKLSNAVLPNNSNSSEPENTIPWIPISIGFLLLNSAAFIYWKLSKKTT